jgi:hypothetical protein
MRMLDLDALFVGYQNPTRCENAAAAANCTARYQPHMQQL